VRPTRAVQMSQIRRKIPSKDTEMTEARQLFVIEIGVSITNSWRASVFLGVFGGHFGIFAHLLIEITLRFVPNLLPTTYMYQESSHPLPR